MQLISESLSTAIECVAVVLVVAEGRENEESFFCSGGRNEEEDLRRDGTREIIGGGRDVGSGKWKVERGGPV